MYDYFIGPNGVFDTPLTATLFTFLQFAFMATESRRKRFAPTDATREQKMFPPLGLAILVGLVARLAFGFLKIGVIRGEGRALWIVVGFVLVIAGWWVRIWSQRELGKFFTGEVAVQSDHRVVTSGLYQWVRHPAYTGGWLAAVGFGLTLSTWLGALVSGAMLAWAYIVRVPREEALMQRELGETYRNYVSRTKRFIPFVF
jgi:protein-S-isoprenylcysteine O-methyltransferase Ste14